jgi:hypothetical protein
VKSVSTTAALCAGFVLLAGCASSSNDIRSAYVSPMTYENYSCQQLVTENARLQQRLSSVAGAVDKKAHGDKVKMGVGLVLFWPTLLFLKGDGAEAQEYARLKGEHEAFDEAYLRKNCSSQVAVAPSIGPVPETTPVVRAPALTYQGNGLSAAKMALAKQECSDKFSVVSEVDGRGVYEATCKTGKRQLMECWAGTCRALN